jgi:dynein heavy chain
LKPGDIVEIKGVKAPSAGVLLVVKTLCLLFSIKPDKKRGQTAKEGIQWDYWTPAKKKLLTPKLLKNCLDFDKDHIDPEIVENIRGHIESPEYSDAELKKASVAAKGLGAWVRAMIAYDDAMKVVKPKQQALAEAQASLKEAQAARDEAQANLAAIQEELRKLQETYDEAENKKK